MPVFPLGVGARPVPALLRRREACADRRRLADALGREPRSFPPLYRAMVAAGESSGSLPDILERQSVLLERQAAMRSKLLSALAYPAVLTLVALVVVNPLGIKDVVESCHAVLLVHGTRAHTAELLHVTADTERRLETAYSRAVVKRGLVASLESYVEA